MVKIVFAFVSLLFITSALAEDGDTNIHIVYKLDIYRVRPEPGQKKPTVTVDIVLHKDGRIEDRFFIAGPKPKPSNSKQRLGSKDSIVQYKVVDTNTISRTYDNGVLWQKITVKVDGKACNASIEYKLNSTLKEYEDYSVELGRMAVFQEPKVVSTQCGIE